ncbi:MAG: hypothetical protein IJI83_01075 [Oscillospiraceae bacterium]|nr:hypothetical protein [Oscillospiraceae bacterium]MBQ6148121.1 hypothetical protein [Oscillospiraceae bacterium]
MYDNITKDGIYRISLSSSNPLAGYLVVKTYGDEQKRRRMCSLDDIKQQVQEWDDDYCRKHSDFENRGINMLLGKKKEKIRPARNYYHVYNDQGDLYLQGYGDELAKIFGCKSKTICNVANTEGRRLTAIINDRKELLNVCKNN